MSKVLIVRFLNKVFSHFKLGSDIEKPDFNDQPNQYKANAVKYAHKEDLIRSTWLPAMFDQDLR